MPLYNPPTPVGVDWLTAGYETFPRELAISTVTSATGFMRICYFTARASYSTTQVRMWTSTTAAAATPTLCRIGLWLAAADGSASSLVASVANDTTLFAAASTSYTRSWSAPYSMVAGQRYAVAALVVSGAATPTFLGATGPAAAAEAAAAPAMAGALSSLSDLPANFASSAAGTAAGRTYMVILP
jgi:hypothetical protein